MSIYLINLLYFAIVAPILLVSTLLIKRLYKNEEKNSLIIIISLCVILFIFRLTLVFFGETIGIMPYITGDVLFYPLLCVFGLIFTWFYLTKIEKKSLKEIGYEIEDIKKSVLSGLIGLIPLFCMMPLMIFLTEIAIPASISITPEKVAVGLAFGLLGAFFEEIFFRGIIQNRISDLVNNDEKKEILIVSLIFAISHLFYLPFTGCGIYYVFVFILALILSWLRIHYDQIATGIVHGGIVFILIILV